ncbi:MbnP family protein [Tenacibaculum finnmarkense]|uniref:MbnP family protein n=1 Tax=Tenacibaculum finnmarkense TaxID=2781243 RepID=UPI00187B66F3|nr:MbnP family protein [Tenacibaculum finnmarkense]MBE7633698.1 hypothetical protein [Tenacibaculum finnmarkense genomovar ulcerans]MBE7645348.1 hypothetical protein [Tenacibaculum finnmarkense genomovar ulcerans]MBE7649083.1 hypothetical protein [Tenacibaculum finnmarkense genomovar ulcerans]MBE7687269.1 hypothetical protein [Tenacibaculum finnmarkense genomovar ulcerans]MCD8401020.1 hypothetical protein [Tenacibaculum finnmarkense genomovar ulcerans]
MNKILSLVAAATLLVSVSCSNNDDELALKGKNDISVEFDHAMADGDFILGTTYTLNDEKITPDALDYIVGNFTLTNEEGKEVAVPGFYIISEGGGTKVKNLKVDLKDVPAGKYTKMKFGIGVDKKTYLNHEETYKADESGDNIDLWVAARKYGLTWSWTAGYKNLAFEGSFTSQTNKEETGYAVHLANTVLYQEITLAIEHVAVSEENAPQIHLKVDVSKTLAGKNTIKLSEQSSIMGGVKAGKIFDNLLDHMFTVDHVHNSGAHH